MSTRGKVANSVRPNPLQSSEMSTSAEAKTNLHKSENRPALADARRENLKAIGQQIRSAIRRADLTLSEASALLDVKDESQFARMLDGLEVLGVHRLLTDKARPIWDELVTLRAKRAGYSVDRVIRIKEA